MSTLVNRLRNLINDAQAGLLSRRLKSVDPDQAGAISLRVHTEVGLWPETQSEIFRTSTRSVGPRRTPASGGGFGLITAR